eukprot:CAMPEP_0168379164 /NCGR_PEP_ID=MMETSP0228-20121227/11703_1 /TAXON_ID=133427 /ORGANISM="Protoceratium reticulatum, Strain CCCM 535 (=CCMP 1889)" /LENGTH=406 /DNA_ID=CAMNT_0008392189 /DNA_START=53 /DNA_END=1273 /DNA_ORIENTATION=+
MAPPERGGCHMLAATNWLAAPYSRRGSCSQRGSACRPRVAVLALLCCIVARPVAGQANIDGGRSELPGMKQDIFDQVQKNKKSGGTAHRGKGPPECPKSDKMSPFFGLAFASGEMYVKLNSTDGQCRRLLTVAGANYTILTNASRTCGPAGEWKKRIAEELSAVFFQGGLEWVKSENETLEVITEDGTFEVEVSEAKYAIQADCWKRGCGCEQANNPKMRMIFLALFVISIGGVGVDGVKLMWEKIKGKKPPKHVECKKGHRMTEVKLAYSHHCDVCGASGTTYQCCVNCNYDMCKKCYKESKKKVKGKWKEWLEKHPEDKEKDKKDKSDKDEEEEKDDDKESGKGDADAESRSEPESTTAGAAVSSKAASEAEQDDDDKKEDDTKEEETKDEAKEEEKPTDDKGE